MDESTRIVWGHQLNMKKDCKYRKMLAQKRNNAKYVHNRRVRKRFTKKITMQICPRCTRKCFTKKKSKCSYVHESARSGGSRVCAQTRGSTSMAGGGVLAVHWSQENNTGKMGPHLGRPKLFGIAWQSSAGRARPVSGPTVPNRECTYNPKMVWKNVWKWEDTTLLIAGGWANAILRQ